MCNNFWKFFFKNRKLVQESVASETSSFELTTFDLENCIDELRHCIEANFGDPLVMAAQGQPFKSFPTGATNDNLPPIIQHSNSDSSLDSTVWDAPRLKGSQNEKITNLAL